MASNDDLIEIIYEIIRNIIIVKKKRRVVFQNPPSPIFFRGVWKFDLLFLKFLAKLNRESLRASKSCEDTVPVVLLSKFH
jgi:hypothetical protein